MGDHFQTVVDRDATPAAAEAVAREVIKWLVGRGVIESGRTDCVLDGDGTGHAPGPNYADVIDLGSDDGDDTPRLRTNGLAVVVGQTVFHAGQGGLELVCRACGDRSDGGDAWSKAVREWYDQKSEGILRCPRCGHAEPVTEWAHDPPWGFGNLGFTFWNWPPLTASFVEEFTRRLGHRTVLVAGKL